MAICRLISVLLVLQCYFVFTVYSLTCNIDEKGRTQSGCECCSVESADTFNDTTNRYDRTRVYGCENGTITETSNNTSIICAPPWSLDFRVDGTRFSQKCLCSGDSCNNATYCLPEDTSNYQSNFKLNSKQYLPLISCHDNATTPGQMQILSGCAECRKNISFPSLVSYVYCAPPVDPRKPRSPCRKGTFSTKSGSIYYEDHECKCCQDKCNMIEELCSVVVSKELQVTSTSHPTTTTTTKGMAAPKNYFSGFFILVTASFQALFWLGAFKSGDEVY